MIVQLKAVHKGEEENFYEQLLCRNLNCRHLAVQKNAPVQRRGVFPGKVLLGCHIDVFFCHQFGKLTLAHIADGNDPPLLLFAGGGFTAFPTDD